MEKIYNYVNESLLLNKKLIDMKIELANLIDESVIYCIKSFENFEKGKYNKIKLTNYSNDLFEIIIIFWNDVESKIHDHSENGCLIYILDGILLEEIYDNKLILTNTNIFNKFNIGYIDNNVGYHKIISPNKSISMHIYSPPNYKINIFN